MVAPSVSAKPANREASRASRLSSERPLGVGEHRPVGSVAVGEAREQVVERRYPAADDRLAAGEEIPPDTLRLGPVGHEQNRVALDIRGIAVEQKSDLAGIRRPRKQRQRHTTQSRAAVRRLI